ncbi:TetR/AcrR family transcriptional regulator [Actinocrispum wychmicini]|uniref:TetR family transcriptional regulator n=1 Tax=Actinocrispum wychmicini TaxID=1213861 RepID=A0A4R2J718_9PSEU|nr:TetR/AcrR family transcriptional regulator [Actinocrispum wychmicini]TCO54861.1 TetR family transcriptional regulator [Actinocrispum wychmicini]
MRNAGQTRAAIHRAARTLFGLHGYAATTVRAIAAEAGCNPSLISRYFGGKAALYASVLTERMADYDTPTGDVTTGQRAREILVRQLDMADGLTEAERRTRVRVLTRSVDPGKPGTAARELTQAVIAEIAGTVTGPDAELRRALIVGQLLGVALLREMMRLPELANVPKEKIVWYFAPALHQLLAPRRPFPRVR